MQKYRPFRPALEALEDRTVPATIRLLTGGLFISNPNGALLIEPQGGTTVKVTDGTVITTFKGVGNIFITGSNKADTITVDTAAGAFNSNMFFNLGNGNDVVTLQGTNDLRGNLTFLPGKGNDTIVFNGTTYGSVVISDTTGNDTAIFGAGQGTKFLGNINALGMNTVVFTDATEVRGRTTIVNANDNLPFTFVDAATTKFFGDVQVRSGSGDDTVVATGLYSGNLNVDVGSATAQNTVVLTGAVDGNVNLRGASSIDIFTVALTAGNAVAGNLSLDAGDGDNQLTLAAGDVFGDLLVRTGNGNNTFAPFGLNVFGSATYLLGNGDNTLDFAGGSVGGVLGFQLGNGTNTVSLTGTVTTGVVRFRSGNGNNTLNITPAAATFFNLDVQFGNGDDTFTSNANATLNGRIDGGIGTDFFDQGGAILLPTLTIANFEAGPS